MTTVIPVILCGGSGTRLWPLSREALPKQFVRFSESPTLFENTLLRSKVATGNVSPIVVCNKSHRFFVSTGLRNQEQQGKVILEPVSRNTAPAIALAALAALERDETAVLLVLPSDHLLRDTKTFVVSVQRAVKLAEQGMIVTFGIIPKSPATGFGYIQRGEELDERAYRIRAFKEKPDEERAKRMLEEGNYYWNSGMFVFSAKTFLQEFQDLQPEMCKSVTRAWKGQDKDGDFVVPHAKFFGEIVSNSIDYAVMEKTARAAVVELDCEWNDLGSWDAFYEAGKKDDSGNVIVGDVIASNSHGNYIHSTSRLIAAVGLENLALVETKDALLVANRNSSQEVKKIVARLEKENRGERITHTLVYRPWGFYESLIVGKGFQVKRIFVSAGGQLSLQRHQHRSEHWVVVSGEARITNGDVESTLMKGQSTFIPEKTIHRLKNLTKDPLVIIEVQCGDYLGEDDIERFDDIYNRV